MALNLWGQLDDTFNYEFVERKSKKPKSKYPPVQTSKNQQKSTKESKKKELTSLGHTKTKSLKTLDHHQGKRRA